MKIEIWSDVVCPFCYIGKRKLEKALAKFPHKNQVKIEWKSFQLNPDQVTDPSLNSLEYLSKSKGWSMPQTLQITSQVVEMAKSEGLEFNMEQTVVANTKNAHRLIHFAEVAGKGADMKERLLNAYFTQGENVDDFETLQNLGTEVGLDAGEIKAMLESDKFHEEVEKDIYESRLIGVQGVPFFVLDRKFGISGAQADQVFDQTLEKAWADFIKENPELQFVQGSDENSCELDGDC
ncbi:DsbA family oxidoreductase [Algoriphagus halophilus]|uniref:Predicted dithiol-disulfide isomerase, DsbA family n=1 Tax=Algoriphagus halophilus TaxID=226505 RepID=A0A1N6DWA5_9BACT|nr:DsbA family oxidoreductase [Algoriphagus halophilus]SIN74974.1 Predicted dithiol-disulfide isomerase, DsbA family [Algoriphagus halophilus]